MRNRKINCLLWRCWQFLTLTRANCLGESNACSVELPQNEWSIILESWLKDMPHWSNNFSKLRNSDLCIMHCLNFQFVQTSVKCFFVWLQSFVVRHRVSFISSGVCSVQVDLSVIFIWYNSTLKVERKTFNAFRIGRSTSCVRQARKIGSRQADSWR